MEKIIIVNKYKFFKKEWNQDQNLEKETYDIERNENLYPEF